MFFYIKTLLNKICKYLFIKNKYYFGSGKWNRTTDLRLMSAPRNPWSLPIPSILTKTYSRNLVKCLFYCTHCDRFFEIQLIVVLKKLYRFKVRKIVFDVTIYFRV